LTRRVRENGRLLRDGRRFTRRASLATDWPVRNGHRVFALPSHYFAEQDEKRGQKQQRNAAADHPDGNFDRKRICDADGVAKEVDQFVHVVLRDESIESEGPSITDRAKKRSRRKCRSCGWG